MSKIRKLQLWAAVGVGYVIFGVALAVSPNAWGWGFIAIGAAIIAISIFKGSHADIYN